MSIETIDERVAREREAAEYYIRSTHKADGNDIKRLEDKLDAILAKLNGEG